MGAAGQAPLRGVAMATRGVARATRGVTRATRGVIMREWAWFGAVTPFFPRLLRARRQFGHVRGHVAPALAIFAAASF